MGWLTEGSGFGLHVSPPPFLPLSRGVAKESGECGELPLWEDNLPCAHICIDIGPPTDTDGRTDILVWVDFPPIPLGSFLITPFLLLRCIFLHQQKLSLSLPCLLSCSGLLLVRSSYVSANGYWHFRLASRRANGN
jgi:hypothetical protein